MNVPTEDTIASLLLDWYDLNARPLPWRQTTDPYSIWISEIMLQQTRVETVQPYFTRWMEHFPTLQSLADASQQEVLQVWEGLGYYSRARNLHRSARIILDEYGGVFPSIREEIQKLPGIGRYTAGALASIVFDQQEATLDGNIRRVYARLCDIDSPAGSKESEARLWELAWQNVPALRPGDFNQALMDLGARICTPRKPQCEECPLSSHCLSFSRGNQEERPVRKASKTIPHYIVTAAIIFRDEQVLITQRPQNGLLAGMWEFPGGKLEPGEELSDCLIREIKEELDSNIQVGELQGIYKHAYTHYQVTLHAFFCHIIRGEPHPLEAIGLKWVSPLELKHYPMGKIDRQISKQLATRLVSS